MKTILKYLLAFVSPVLAYFAYYGHVGANNLLYVWPSFGVLMAVLLSMFAGLAAFCFFIFGEKELEKHKETLEKVRQNFFNLQKFTFHTFVDIGCMVFYVWTGWWVLFFLEFVQFFIVKLIAFMTPENLDK